MFDKGLVDQVAGKAKEVVGKMTDDKKLQAEGVVEQSIGKAKEVANDLVDKVKEEVNKKLN